MLKTSAQVGMMVRCLHSFGHIVVYSTEVCLKTLKELICLDITTAYLTTHPHNVFTQMQGCFFDICNALCNITTYTDGHESTQCCD